VIRRLALVGTGLIGASVGLAAKRAGVGRVAGFDPDPEALAAGFLARWIGEAAGHRRSLLADAFADPGALQRLRVHVPDRPGVLAAVTQALGAERINIEDFALRHVSPERGGTLTLLVAGEDAAGRAAALLDGQGYGVVVSPVLEREA
jgi:hypothetical protein